MRMPAACRAAPLQVERLVLRAGGATNGRILCNDLDLCAAPGERWVLLGPNGAGKSTFLMALAGLVRPHAGSTVLAGQALSRWHRQRLAHQRAWCPQFWLDPFPASAWETVACAILATQPDLDHSAVEQNARHWLHRLDVAAVADHDVRRLSGGERQRVALATAFAQGAPLLLLDEPTSHLDWPHQGLLRRLLVQWSAEQGTVFVAMHDVNLAWSFATHCLLLDGAGGATVGPREQVFTAAAIGGAYGVSVSVLEENGRCWFRADSEDRP